jgi:hypothetical protein
LKKAQENFLVLRALLKMEGDRKGKEKGSDRRELLPSPRGAETSNSTVARHIAKSEILNLLAVILQTSDPN